MINLLPGKWVLIVFPVSPLILLFQLIIWEGEGNEREDGKTVKKDKQMKYTFIDLTCKRKYVYSWKLNKLKNINDRNRSATKTVYRLWLLASIGAFVCVAAEILIWSEEEDERLGVGFHWLVKRQQPWRPSIWCGVHAIFN